MTRAGHGARARLRTAARALAVALVLAGVGALALYAAGEEEDEAAPAAGEPAPLQLPEGCERGRPPGAGRVPERYDAPEQVTEPGVDYRARIETSCGTIEMDLLESDAPAAVNSFVFLARNGFYDGRRWVRVERRFLIQTGDPNDELLVPPEGAGYTLPDELPDRPQDYVCGEVATTSAGAAGTGSSGFFIVAHDCDELLEQPDAKPEPAGLQKLYSIFGRVEPSSYDAVVALSRVPPKGGDDPVELVEPAVPVYVESVEIEER